LGLDNAATPFGLKAMKSLEELNPTKGTASNAQIMFLVLHTSGLTLIPLSIIALRSTGGELYSSVEPASIFIPCVLATVMASIASVIVVGIRQKLKLDGVLLAWITSLLGAVCLLLFFISRLDDVTKNDVSKIYGNLILLSIILAIIGGGVYKKINCFDAFIDGAKEGFDVILRILPYLVGMLVSIQIFRDSGAFDYIIHGAKSMCYFFGVNTDFVDALPVAIMKPFSGSGARGLLVDVYANPALGPDSFAGKLASIFQGSADTTFYIIALYFGSVGIKNIRYSIWAGLLADFLGVISAIIIGYIFFH
jgi:spore maturation protein SpmB